MCNDKVSRGFGFWKKDSRFRGRDYASYAGTYDSSRCIARQKAWCTSPSPVFLGTWPSQTTKRLDLVRNSYGPSHERSTLNSFRCSLLK